MVRIALAVSVALLALQLYLGFVPRGLDILMSVISLIDVRQWTWRSYSIFSATLVFVLAALKVLQERTV